MILPYSTNVLEYLDCQAPRAKDRVYGAEVEIEPRPGHMSRDVARALNAPAGDWYILKADGSLENGIEIVSLPLTLDGHSDGRWTRLMKPIMASARSGAGTTRCGLHVHANRANISALTLGKILVFVNHPANEWLIDGVAQRSRSRWCQKMDKSVKDAVDYVAYDRYQAVNVTRHTVEFRIFRGTIRPERILKCIEFVDAVIAYCEGTSIAAIGKDTADATTAGRGFVRFVNANRAAWPNLHGFLVESGLNIE